MMTERIMQIPPYSGEIKIQVSLFEQFRIAYKVFSKT